MTTTTRRPRAIVNRYAGKCVNCHTPVDAGAGYAHKKDSGKWATECPTCAAVDRRTLPTELRCTKQLKNRKQMETAVHTCTSCNAHIAWVQNKHDKWYMANVVSKHGAYIAGVIPHECKPPAAN